MTLLILSIIGVAVLGLGLFLYLILSISLPTQPPISGEDDEMMQQVLARCLQSGKMVVGHRNIDGSFEITEYPKEHKHE